MSWRRSSRNLARFWSFISRCWILRTAELKFAAMDFLMPLWLIFIVLKNRFFLESGVGRYMTFCFPLRISDCHFRYAGFLFIFYSGLYSWLYSRTGYLRSRFLHLLPFWYVSQASQILPECRLRILPGRVQRFYWDHREARGFLL